MWLIINQVNKIALERGLFNLKLIINNSVEYILLCNVQSQKSQSNNLRCSILRMRKQILSIK